MSFPSRFWGHTITLNQEQFDHVFGTNVCVVCNYLMATCIHWDQWSIWDLIILRILTAILHISISRPLCIFARFATDNGTFVANNSQVHLHWWGINLATPLQQGLPVWWGSNMCRKHGQLSPEMVTTHTDNAAFSSMFSYTFQVHTLIISWISALFMHGPYLKHPQPPYTYTLEPRLCKKFSQSGCKATLHLISTIPWAACLVFQQFR